MLFDSEFIKPYVLDLEKAARLKRLGFAPKKEPSFYWRQCYPLKEGKILLIDKEERAWYDLYNYKRDFKFIPTYTLQEIWENLPKIISHDGVYLLKYDFQRDIIHYSTGNDLCCLVSFDKDKLQNAYDMLCWVLENGHLKTK